VGLSGYLLISTEQCPVVLRREHRQLDLHRASDWIGDSGIFFYDNIDFPPSPEVTSATDGGGVRSRIFPAFISSSEGSPDVRSGSEYARLSVGLDIKLDDSPWCWPSWVPRYRLRHQYDPYTRAIHPASPCSAPPLWSRCTPDRVRFLFGTVLFGSLRFRMHLSTQSLIDLSEHSLVQLSKIDTFGAYYPRETDSVVDQHPCSLLYGVESMKECRAYLPSKS
jgi:hypothetical protein